MECRATVAQRRDVPSDAGERVRVETRELQARVVDRLRSAQARAPKPLRAGPYPLLTGRALLGGLSHEYEHAA